MRCPAALMRPPLQRTHACEPVGWVGVAVFAFRAPANVGARSQLLQLSESLHRRIGTANLYGECYAGGLSDAVQSGRALGLVAAHALVWLTRTAVRDVAGLPDHLSLDSHTT